MITPDEVVSKVKKLYRRGIHAWLTRDSGFFPYRLRVDVSRDTDTNVARQAQIRLVDHAKTDSKPGYSLKFQEIKSRRHATQRFVTGVYVDSIEDLVALTGKQREFKTLKRCIEMLEKELPELGEWCHGNWPRLIKHSNELAELIEFAKYVRNHPMPGCHLRELPVAISTKTIDRCENLMTQWLEILLPPWAQIKDGNGSGSGGGKTFSQRFGFEESKDHFRLRLLDDDLRSHLALPCAELSLPVETLAALQVSGCHVIIVENKVNLIKLPQTPRTLALGGLGLGIVRLFELPWLESNRLSYWGDIDVEGFEILGAVRRRFPHTVSLLMDSEPLDRCAALTIQGNMHRIDKTVPVQLTEPERLAFERCRSGALRLEQERLPREFVRLALEDLQCLDRTSP